MKRLILVIVFALGGILTAQAQWFLGGSVNANLNKDLKTFTIAPDAGYYFDDTPFSVGCAVEYSGSHSNDEGYTHSLTLSPYFRYDIFDISERFSFFTDLVADIDVLELGWFDIGLSPGVSFDLTEHWSAEFSAGFLGYEWERVPNEKPIHNFVLSFETVAPSFRIYYNF